MKITKTAHYRKVKKQQRREQMKQATNALAGLAAVGVVILTAFVIKHPPRPYSSLKAGEVYINRDNYTQVVAEDWEQPPSLEEARADAMFIYSKKKEKIPAERIQIVKSQLSGGVKLASLPRSMQHKW